MRSHWLSFCGTIMTSSYRAKPGSPGLPATFGQRKHRGKRSSLCFFNFTIIAMLLAACAPSQSTIIIENMITPLAPTPVPAPTSERPEYAPGELVDYTAQSGDTLLALSARFNTTDDQI